MLTFDTDRHDFTVKGVVYYLEALDFDAASYMASLEGKPFEEQVDALALLLKSKARTDVPAWWLWLRRKPTPEGAVTSLSMTQQARLFQSWLRAGAAGLGMVVPGESKGSAD